jgi:hypothetical protein
VHCTHLFPIIQFTSNLRHRGQYMIINIIAATPKTSHQLPNQEAQTLTPSTITTSIAVAEET